MTDNDNDNQQPKYVFVVLFRDSVWSHTNYYWEELASFDTLKEAQDFIAESGESSLMDSMEYHITRHRATDTPSNAQDTADTDGLEDIELTPAQAEHIRADLRRTLKARANERDGDKLGNAQDVPPSATDTDTDTLGTLYASINGKKYRVKVFTHSVWIERQTPRGDNMRFYRNENGHADALLDTESNVWNLDALGSLVARYESESENE